MAFNTKCGPLKPGTKCVWLADNGSSEEPMKIKIEAGGGGDDDPGAPPALPEGKVRVRVSVDGHHPGRCIHQRQQVEEH